MSLLQGALFGFILAQLIGLLFFIRWNRALRREITERKQAEEALRASEERFKDFAETAADWFWEKDQSLKFTYLSDRFQQSTGWNPEHVLGRTLQECFSTPDADKEKWDKHFQDLAARKPYQRFESRWVRHDGTLAVLSTSGRPMFDTHGNFQGYRGVGRDITQRKRAEDTLRKLSRTVEQSPNMVFITDTDGVIEYVNQGFTQISGYTPEEALGSTPRILKSGQTPIDVYRDLWRTIKAGRIWRGELYNKRKNGGMFWNFVSISPIADKHNHITHFTSIQIDVTERKRAEDALKEGEARLRAITNALPDLLFLLDDEGHYIEVLSSQRHLLEGNADTLKGRRIDEVLPSKVAANLLEAVKTTLATGGTQVIEYELQISGAGKYWFEARTAPIETLGPARPAVVIAARDITERKTSDEQLRQAQKMEAIGQLTGGIAHDFNNLLAIVLGNLELLEEQLGAQDHLQDLVHRAVEAAERGATLTRHLLAFSRRQPLQPRPINLNEMVSRMTDLLKRTLGETIQIETVLASDLWSTLADLTQLENALLNLALNARDAMLNGGMLTISTINSHLDTSYSIAGERVPPGDYVVLAVSDTGSGMAPEVAKNAFQPFFTTKGVGKGTGLGLSMVYGLVKQLGGYVEINSELGLGSCVRLFLARTRIEHTPEAIAASPNKPDKVAKPTETILVVEDDHNVRQLAVNMLQSLGYTTLETDRGETALSILRETPQVNLLFTDVVLPGGMSGGQLALEARAHFPRLKVLFTSGYTKHALVHRGRLDETVDLLAKPYRKADLAKKLRAVLDGSPRP